jgi:hypothetical protein
MRSKITNLRFAVASLREKRQRHLGGGLLVGGEKIRVGSAAALPDQALIFPLSVALQTVPTWSSIEDQVRVCRQRIDREGWTLAATYSDAATSGADAADSEPHRT